MATPSLPTIWDSFPELNEPLQAVLTKMSNSWRIGFSEIDNAIRSQLNAGKLVRPALTLLFSELTAQPYNKKAIALGASVELLHLATLIMMILLMNPNCGVALKVSNRNLAKIPQSTQGIIC